MVAVELGVVVGFAGGDDTLLGLGSSQKVADLAALAQAIAAEEMTTSVLGKDLYLLIASAHRLACSLLL